MNLNSILFYHCDRILIELWSEFHRNSIRIWSGVEYLCTQEGILYISNFLCTTAQGYYVFLIIV